MSEIPPPPPPEDSAISSPPARTNGPAIASLVCGILGCIPFITGLAAVILGIVGIRKARDPHVTDRGMAIAGLVLGVISVVGWSLFGLTLGGGLYAVFQAAAPARAVAEQFTRDLSAGNVDEALARSATGMDRAALAAASDGMKSWGPLQSLGMTSVNMSTVNGVSRCELGGSATFAKATKPYSMTLIDEGGTYKVSKFHFE